MRGEGFREVVVRTARATRAGKVRVAGAIQGGVRDNELHVHDSCIKREFTCSMLMYSQASSAQQVRSDKMSLHRNIASGHREL